MKYGVSRETISMLIENKSALEKTAVFYHFSPRQKKQFELYVDVLEEWSRRTNLISKNDLPKIVTRHIVESLEVARQGLIVNASHVLDVGTGSGFPGVPLSIFYPDVKFTLLDSKRMKILFLKDVVDYLGLSNAQPVCERAEHFTPSILFDIVTARAVTCLNELWVLAHPLLKPAGALVALKGGDVKDEILELQRNFDVCTKIFLMDDMPFYDSPDKKIVLVSHSKVTGF